MSNFAEDAAREAQEDREDREANIHIDNDAFSTYKPSIKNDLENDDRATEIHALADDLTYWSDSSKDWTDGLKAVIDALKGDTTAMAEVISKAKQVAELECAEANAGASI